MSEESESDRKIRLANEDPAYQEFKKKELENFRKSVEKAKAPTGIVVKVESKNNLEQSKLWNQSLSDLKTAYVQIGKDFDPESVTSTEQVQWHYDNVVRLSKAQKLEVERGKKEPTGGGVGLSGAQYGDEECFDPSIRPCLREWLTEQDMIEDLRRTSKDGLTPDIRREAQQSLSQLWKKSLKSLERGGEAVFEGELTKAIQSKAHESEEEKAERKEEASKWRIKK